MQRETDTLTFFCNLCNHPIEKNICPVHGIDFVTIKKSPPKQEAGNAGASTLALNANPNMLPGAAPSAAPLEIVPRQSALRPQVNTQPLRPRIVQGALSQNPGRERAEVTDAEIVGVSHPESAAATSTARTHKEFPGLGTHGREPAAPARAGYRPSHLFLALVVGAILALAVSLFYFSRPAQQNPSGLFAQAENLLAGEDAAGALQLYRQFAAEFPDDPLIGMVRKRLTVLEAEENQRLQQQQMELQQQIADWLLKADVAFSEGRLVAPAAENALNYVRRVLAVVPEQPSAVALREKIIAYYHQQAEEALSRGQYNAAIGHYETLLEINPADTGLIKKIQSVLAQKEELAEK